MDQNIPVKIIAHIYTDFGTKFGIPRQSGLVEELQGKIVFEKEYRNPDAFRGLEEYSHIWLLWQFSEAIRPEWSPTVRPPLLGGNTRMGVFATRSPFRPNPIGLSCVKLEKVELNSPDGPVLYVRGADMVNGTPIYDIKPYLVYADSHPEAVSGFTEHLTERRVEVEISETMLAEIPEEKREALLGVLREDPRPSYQKDAERIYGFSFDRWEIKFRGNEKKITVIEIKMI